MWLTLPSFLPSPIWSAPSKYRLYDMVHPLVPSHLGPSLLLTTTTQLDSLTTHSKINSCQHITWFTDTNAIRITDNTQYCHYFYIYFQQHRTWSIPANILATRATKLQSHIEQDIPTPDNTRLTTWVYLLPACCQHYIHTCSLVVLCCAMLGSSPHRDSNSSSSNKIQGKLLHIIS